MPRSCVVKSVCISFFVIVAIFTMSHVEPVFPRTDVAFYRGLDLVVTGVVDSEVTVRSNSQRFYFVAESVQVQAVQKNLTALQSALLARAVAGKIAVDGPLYPARAFGEKLELHGMLESPPADSPTYVRYLQKEGIYATIKPRTVRSLGDSFRPELRSLLMRFRSYLQIRVDGLFTDPVSGIVLGLLLGIRSTLPPGILADFQTAGLTHILAISGYNITLLITICAGLLRQRSRRVRFGVTIFTILCFAIITGLSASVVRASLMGALTVLAQFWGRKSDGVQALLVSGALMVALNPLILLWDIGFQLSFLSTLGLLILLPRWEHIFAPLGPFAGEALSVTLSATVFTTPLILYDFARFSLISPLANIIFLPLVPFIMATSFFGLVVSFIFPPFSLLFTGLTWILTMLLTQGVHLFANIPFASVQVSEFSFWMLVLSYGLLALFLTVHKPRRGRGSVLCPVQASGSLSTVK